MLPRPENGTFSRQIGHWYGDGTIAGKRQGNAADPRKIAATSTNAFMHDVRNKRHSRAGRLPLGREWNISVANTLHASLHATVSGTMGRARGLIGRRGTGRATPIWEPCAMEKDKAFWNSIDRYAQGGETLKRCIDSFPCMRVVVHQTQLDTMFPLSPAVHTQLSCRDGGPRDDHLRCSHCMLPGTGRSCGTHVFLTGRRVQCAPFDAASPKSGKRR